MQPSFTLSEIFFYKTSLCCLFLDVIYRVLISKKVLFDDAFIGAKMSALQDMNEKFKDFYQEGSELSQHLLYLFLFHSYIKFDCPVLNKGTHLSKYLYEYAASP
jgi:hypothetical protein